MKYSSNIELGSKVVFNNSVSGSKVVLELQLKTNVNDPINFIIKTPINKSKGSFKIPDLIPDLRETEYLKKDL